MGNLIPKLKSHKCVQYRNDFPVCFFITIVSASLTYLFWLWYDLVDKISGNFLIIIIVETLLNIVVTIIEEVLINLPMYLGEIRQLVIEINLSLL
jgi:hypothetical protein